MRVAETRAVNRALRKAYGIGICSVEELGPGLRQPRSNKSEADESPANRDGHKLRDRLRLVIRQHRLDPNLVKGYAAHFCQASELRHAEKAKIEQFVYHLSQYASHNRDDLLKELNRYAGGSEGAA